MDFKKILMDYVGKDIYVGIEEKDGSRMEYVIHCYTLVQSSNGNGEFYRIVSQNSEMAYVELDLAAEVTRYRQRTLLVDVEARSRSLHYHIFIADAVEDM